MAAPVRQKHAATGRGEYRSDALLAHVGNLVSREPESFAKIRRTTTAKGLPPISIGPDEGRILHFLVKASSAKKVVEVGTLAGYSACWLASALPGDGVLHTLEYDPKHAEVARANIKEAGLTAKVTVHVGPALGTLPALAAAGPYDLVFIDADKASYHEYAHWAAENLRPGGFCILDNAYLFGKLHMKSKEAGEDAAGVPAMNAALELLADERYFSSCAMIPTGEGMAVAVKK
jgi:caffeoyl-CoA O-methyltransferase